MREIVRRMLDNEEENNNSEEPGTKQNRKEDSDISDALKKGFMKLSDEEKRIICNAIGIR